MSKIVDLIIDPLSLPLSPILEWIILLIIGEIAYRLAYGVVGEAYSDGFISSSSVGSILHWIVRLFFFIVVWGITYCLIEGCKFVYANRKIIIIIGSIALCILLIVMIIKQNSKKKEEIVSTNQENENKTAE